MSTVLLVEDDPEIVALLADFLAVEGYGVVSAPDSGGAIDALGAHPIACVVLDVMLPGGPASTSAAASASTPTFRCCS